MSVPPTPGSAQRSAGGISCPRSDASTDGSVHEAALLQLLRLAERHQFQASVLRSLNPLAYWIKRAPSAGESCWRFPSAVALGRYLNSRRRSRRTPPVPEASRFG